MKRIPFCPGREALAVGCLALSLGLSVLPSWAGDISGTVVIKTPIRTRPVGPKAFKIKSQPPLVDDETLNVVLYLEKIDPHLFTVPTVHPRMVQEHKTFLPDVLPIVAGQTVDFPNNDHIFHDVYSESPGGEFELTDYKGGDVRSHQFGAPGVVELFCGIHSGMNAYILVLQNPFFAKPDGNHTYTIHGVPPGHYSIRAWHPRLDARAEPVDVPASGTVRLDFEL